MVLQLGRPSGQFTQHRRLDRVRELLERHPRGLTLYELADGLKVSPRTMRRYLKEVGRDSDLEPHRIRAGGQIVWRISQRDLPRKVELRRTQVYALLAARRLFQPLKGTALHEEIDLAVNKLLAFAQRPGRGPNAGLAEARLEDRFLYLPHTPKDYANKLDELDDLFQAVADLRPLHLAYKSHGKEHDERITVHPYAMVFHRDAIYCVGFHTGRHEIRTLLVDRMRDTQCETTERFVLPDDFSIEDYFQGEFGIWRSTEKHKIVVEFDAAAAEYVKTRKVHQTQRLVPIAGGGLRLSMTVGDLTPVVSWVLEWGPRATALEPPELVRRVAYELRTALQNYEPTSPGARKSKRRRTDR
jgi:predicted DNA-binding transcriptional regulator YafY